MHARVDSTWLTAAIGIAAAGVALMYPGAGILLITVAFLVLLLGVRIEGWHVRVLPAWRSRVHTWGPWALIIGGPLLGIFWLFLPSLEKKIPPLVKPELAGISQPSVASLPQTMGPIRIESIGADKTKQPIQGLYKLKPEIPEILITRGPAPYSHDLSVLANIFSRAGINVATGVQQTEGPDQSGLMICVPDVNSIPDAAKKVAGLLRNVGVETKFIVFHKATISSVVPEGTKFTLFIGPQPL